MAAGLPITEVQKAQVIILRILPLLLSVMAQAQIQRARVQEPEQAEVQAQADTPAQAEETLVAAEVVRESMLSENLTLDLT